VFATPGFRLPKPPRLLYSHPPGVKTRSLGRLTSGDPFINRSMESTPFKFVSTIKVTSDLPLIYDGKVDYSVAFLDHRVSIGVT
jgi:DNA (cytosine-5)-methyltransferase 1